MNINLNEDASIATMICTLIIGATLFASYGCHESESTRRAAIEAGLVEKMEPTGNARVWTKE